MIDYAQILEKLRTRYPRKTYSRIAKDAGVAYSYVRELITGQRQPEKMSLEIFSKLFPSATIDWTGQHATQTIGDHSNGNIQQAGCAMDGSDRKRLALIDAVCDLELAPEDQARVLHAIKHVMTS